MENNSNTYSNTLAMRGNEPRPVYEQKLLLLLDKLLLYCTQYDGLTNEERHEAYHYATALLTMFTYSGIPCPQHYLEWITEITIDFVEGGR